MVLEDHVKRGKRLLPPFLASGFPLRETRWNIERLPELFWIAYILERIGNCETLDLACQFSVAVQSTVREVRGNKDAIRAYHMSQHMSLSADEKQEIAARSHNTPWRRSISPYFADMAAVWPDLPIKYLLLENAEEPADRGALVAQIRTLLGACQDRHDKLALFIQAIAVAVELRLGTMSIAEGLPIPNLNAVFHYPHTEESEQAAGFVVAACNALIMGPQQAPDSSWQRSFWNTCYRLQACEYE
jgi:hypothetical protein